MKANTKNKVGYTHYIKAYLAEVPNKENPNDIVSQTKIVFSKSPISPQQFTPLFMGIAEAYAEQLLTNNSPESIYEHFNNAFGIFLRKILPEEKIYALSKPHMDFKEHVDQTLSQPEDKIDTENNRLAAYLLTKDILTKEVGLTEESADLVLNKRLGLLTPVVKGGDVNGESDEETEERKAKD
jgi:hypothetical protein